MLLCKKGLVFRNFTGLYRDVNPIQHLCDELKHGPWTRSSYPSWEYDQIKSRGMLENKLVLTVYCLITPEVKNFYSCWEYYYHCESPIERFKQVFFGTFHNFPSLLLLLSQHVWNVIKVSDQKKDTYFQKQCSKTLNVLSCSFFLS